MRLNEEHRALNKFPARLPRQGHVRKPTGPRPAPNRYQHLQLRILPLESVQNLEVLAVVREPFHHLPVLNIGEGIVYARQLGAIHLVWLKDPVLHKDIPNDCLLCRQNTAQEQRKEKNSH